MNCYTITDIKDNSYISIWQNELHDEVVLCMSKYPFFVHTKLACSNTDIEELMKRVALSAENGLSEFTWQNTANSMKTSCYRNYDGKYIFSLSIIQDRTCACVCLNIDVNSLVNFMDYSIDEDDNFNFPMPYSPSVMLTTYNIDTASDVWTADYQIIGNCFCIKGRRDMSIEYDMNSLIEGLHQLLFTHADFTYQVCSTAFVFHIRELSEDTFEVELDCSTECTSNFIESSLIVNASVIRELYSKRITRDRYRGS